MECKKKMNRLACKCGCTRCNAPFGKEFLKYRKNKWNITVKVIFVERDSYL